MADVARIELARGQAYHAADATPTPTPRLHRSVQVLHLTQPAVSIWAAHLPGAQPVSLADKGPEIALIWRDASFDVPVAAISAEEAAWITAQISGSIPATPNHDPLLDRLLQSGAIVAA
jgi:hypothetical protein